MHQGRFASVFCQSTNVPDEGVLRCTTRFENAHGTEFRELLYRWHPWFGLQVCTHGEIDKADGGVFCCTLSGSDAARCLEVPTWMFDRTACAGVRAAAGAHSDLAALTALAALLRHALSDRFASSNALLSGAPRPSHDQNRGDVHATSDEADACATPRVIADRSVRRRPAKGDRRDAGLVRPTDRDTSGTDRLDDTVADRAHRQERSWLDDGERS